MSNNLVQYLNQYKYEYVVKETGVKLEFAPITTGQIKNLLVHEGEESIGQMEKMIDELIVGCVKTEGFDIGELTIQDRFDLLIEIRKRTKGNMYSFITQCPECNVDTVNSVDLDELEIKPFPTDISQMVTLSENLIIELDFIRRKYQREAYGIVDKKNNKGSERQKMVDMTVGLYARCIKKFVTPAGDVDDATLMDKQGLIEALDSDTYAKISDWFADSNYGTEFKYTIKCHGCDYTEEKDIPISDFFA